MLSVLCAPHMELVAGTGPPPVLKVLAWMECGYVETAGRWLGRATVDGAIINDDAAMLLHNAATAMA